MQYWPMLILGIVVLLLVAISVVAYLSKKDSDDSDQPITIVPAASVPSNTPVVIGTVAGVSATVPAGSVAPSMPIVAPAPAPTPAPAPAPVAPVASAPSDEQQYGFMQGKDSAGYDIQQVAGDIATRKAWCTLNANCRGFNTSGWMKNTIRPASEWDTAWQPDQPDQGLYIKQ